MLYDFQSFTFNIYLFHCHVQKGESAMLKLRNPIGFSVLFLQNLIARKPI